MYLIEMLFRHIFSDSLDMQHKESKLGAERLFTVLLKSAVLGRDLPPLHGRISHVYDVIE